MYIYVCIYIMYINHVTHSLSSADISIFNKNLAFLLSQVLQVKIVF